MGLAGVDVRHVSPVRLKRDEAGTGGAGPSGYASSVFGAVEAALVRHASMCKGVDAVVGVGGVDSGSLSRTRVDVLVRKVFELRDFVGAGAADSALCEMLLGANEEVATAAEHWFMKEGTPDGAGRKLVGRDKADGRTDTQWRTAGRVGHNGARTFADPAEQERYDLKGKAFAVIPRRTRARRARVGQVVRGGICAAGSGVNSTEESEEVDWGSTSESGWSSNEECEEWEVPTTNAMSRRRAGAGGIVFRSPTGAGTAVLGTRSPLKRRPSTRPSDSDESDSSSVTGSSVGLSPSASGSSSDVDYAWRTNEVSVTSQAEGTVATKSTKKKKKNTYWKRFKRALTSLTGYRRKRKEPKEACTIEIERTREFPIGEGETSSTADSEPIGGRDRV